MIVIIFIEKNVTLRGNENLEIIVEKKWKKIILKGNNNLKKNFKPGGSRANQETSYDIENTSIHKPSNIIQIKRQDTKKAIISERNT